MRLSDSTDDTTTTRRSVRDFYEVDPLICPECSGPMRLVSFIEEEDVTLNILEHLKLWEEQEPRPPTATSPP